MTDPGFNQLHLYVCMMIELKDYALTDKSKAVFELCKTELKNKVIDYPTAKMVIDAYCSVSDPHQMPKELTETNYTQKYVDEVNSLLTEIFLSETPSDMIDSFYKLSELSV